MTITSLFSGAGGLDLGLIQAGNEVVWANDIDQDAAETYSANIGQHIICKDIKEIPSSEIPVSDVVVGGFPCQGFSIANLRRDVSDERNQLYRFFLTIVEEKQPKFFIAENVKGLLSLGKGAVIKQISDDFRNAGYLVEVHKIDAADYGVPQHRERVIIIGQRKDISPEMLFSFPRPTHSKNGENLPMWVSMKSALTNVPENYDPEADPNAYGSAYRFVARNFTAHRVSDPDKPSPTILARGNGKGGVCAIPHYNGQRRLTIRESAIIQTFPCDFVFHGRMGSCYRQIGNAVPVLFAKKLGAELKRLETRCI
ncbi:MAG TPA: DNA (cytosine-5-)-methyltransferase [Porphyromonadaceae bacterium]|nr:DNA (cytosine-5-)-methyltransferase [Porphyromonadaceae bacterium]